LHNFATKYIGSALITHDGRKGWINRVVVLPEHRNKGIARKLVEAGEIWLKTTGDRNICLPDRRIQ